MNIETYDKMIFPNDFQEDKKEYYIEYFNRVSKEKNRLCVVYNPNCGCEIDQMVVLDRYPMSEKIISMCPECQKGCLMEISDPIIFHYPLTEQDYSLEELKQMHITDSNQKLFIESYINTY